MISKLVGSSVLIAIAIMTLWPGNALAAGVGASPSELHFDAQVSGYTQTLHVVNTGDTESSYRIYAEGDYETWFEISPGEFSLASGRNREVAITLSPPPSASGEHTANICVVSLEPSSGLQVGVGVKVPAHLSIAPPALPTPTAPATSEAPPPRIQMWIVIAVVAPLLLMAVFLFWQIRRRTIGAR
jgi:hypothetical protein